jgi:hypothetical protein
MACLKWSAAGARTRMTMVTESNIYADALLESTSQEVIFSSSYCVNFSYSNGALHNLL